MAWIVWKSWTCSRTPSLTASSTEGTAPSYLQLAGVLSLNLVLLMANRYGQRVSERDHGPGGFALELGLKDVTLVTDTAHASSTPMPFASVLRDRYLSARAQVSVPLPACHGFTPHHVAGSAHAVVVATGHGGL